MDSRTPERARPPDRSVSSATEPTPEAIDFVRFCHRRRAVGWPELYDEMCAVVGRGLFHGWGAEELNANGLGLTLFEMPRLAGIVHRVVAEDAERRRAAGFDPRAVSRRTARVATPDGGTAPSPELVADRSAPAAGPAGVGDSAEVPATDASTLELAPAVA